MVNLDINANSSSSFSWIESIRNRVGPWPYGVLAIVACLGMKSIFVGLDELDGFSWLLILAVVLTSRQGWTFVAGLVPLLVLLMVGYRRQSALNQLDFWGALVPGTCSLLVLSLTARFVAARNQMFLASARLSAPWIRTAVANGGETSTKSDARTVTWSELPSLGLLPVCWLIAQGLIVWANADASKARVSFALLPQTLMASRLILAGAVVLLVLHGLRSYVQLVWASPELARSHLRHVLWQWLGADLRRCAAEIKPPSCTSGNSD